MVTRKLALCVLMALAWGRAAGADPADVAVVEVVAKPDAGPLAPVLADVMGGAFRFEDVALAELSSPGLDVWAATPPARLVPCVGEPLSPSDLEEALAGVEAHLFELEYDVAEEGLERLTESLCACTRPVPTSVQPRILYLQGILRFYAGDREASRDYFALAAGSQPDLEWDTTFPPDAQQVFLLGLADAVRAAPARFIPPDAADKVQLFVDGTLVPEEGVRIAASRHVLQMDAGDGAMVGAWIVPESAEEVGLVSIEEVRGALRSADVDEDQDGYLGMLTQAAREREYEHLLLITEPGRRAGWWCDLGHGEWSAVPVLEPPALREVKAYRAGGGVLLGSGAALTAVGIAVAAANRSAALEMKAEMESSAAMYDMQIDAYMTHRSRTGGGFALALAGGACVAAGIALIARSVKLEQTAAAEPQLDFAVTPDSAWVSLSGRW